MKTIDWNTYRFRCSQLYKLNTGRFGLTQKQEEEIVLLETERDTGLNINGNKVKWSPTKEEKLEGYLKIKETPLLDLMPKTMKTELREIHRAELYNRNFIYTNAYIQKGLSLEDEAITMYMNYRNANGIRTFFTKNGERLFGDYWSGEPDLRPVKILEGEYKGLVCGFDIKNSYDLSTFPYPNDPLIDQYECQNQGYIELEKADMWMTVSCLCNGTEQMVHNEKLKWMYALSTQKDGTPESNPQHPYYNEYVSKCKDVERNFIYDLKRFKELNPYHVLEHSDEEWIDGGYDIPAAERIVEKISMRDEFKISTLKERVEIGREYLKYLDKQ